MYVHGTIGMVRVAKATLCISSEKTVVLCKTESAKRCDSGSAIDAIRRIRTIPASYFAAEDGGGKSLRPFRTAKQTTDTPPERLL